MLKHFKYISIFDAKQKYGKTEYDLLDKCRRNFANKCVTCFMPNHEKFSSDDLPSLPFKNTIQLCVYNGDIQQASTFYVGYFLNNVCIN